MKSREDAFVGRLLLWDAWACSRDLGIEDDDLCVFFLVPSLLTWSTRVSWRLLGLRFLLYEGKKIRVCCFFCTIFKVSVHVFYCNEMGYPFVCLFLVNGKRLELFSTLVCFICIFMLTMPLMYFLVQHS